MARNVAVIALGNLCSKGLAVLREVLFAAWFGTGDTATAFRVAQTAYLLPTQALVGDSLGAGLLPLYRKLRAVDADAGRLLVLLAALYGTVFSFIVMAVLYYKAEVISAFIAPGAGTSTQALSAYLLKVMALSTPFYVLSGMLSYVEAAFGKYNGIALRSSLINVGSLVGAGLAAFLKQDHWLASGLVISHGIFFVWTVVSLVQLDRLLPSKRPSVTDAVLTAKSFAKNMIPLLGLPLAAQLNVLVERMVSSELGPGVIPSVDYARFVVDTAVQLIAMPLGVLTMSSYGGSAKQGELRAHVRDATGLALVISVPLSIYILCNATSIVRLLFARGAFNAHSLHTTSSILAWMGGCLAATLTAYYLVKALNAELRNSEALLAIVLGCVANMLVNVFLWPVFGPQTIGMAVTAYSVVVFSVCIFRLGIRGLSSLCSYLLGGALVLLLSLMGVSSYVRYPFDLIAGAVLTIGAWLMLVKLAPPVRRAASPLLHRVPHLKRYGF